MTPPYFYCEGGIAFPIALVLLLLIRGGMGFLGRSLQLVPDAQAGLAWFLLLLLLLWRLERRHDEHLCQQLGPRVFGLRSRAFDARGLAQPFL